MADPFLLNDDAQPTESCNVVQILVPPLERLSLQWFPRKIVSWSSTWWKQLAKDQIRVFQGVDIDMLCEFGWICLFLFVFKNVTKSCRVLHTCIHDGRFVCCRVLFSCYGVWFIIHIVVIHIGIQFIRIYIHINIYIYIQSCQEPSGRIRQTWI